MTNVTLYKLEYLAELSKAELLHIDGGSIDWGFVAFCVGLTAAAVGGCLIGGGVGAVITAKTYTEIIAGGSIALTGVGLVTAGGYVAWSNG